MPANGPLACLTQEAIYEGEGQTHCAATLGLLRLAGVSSDLACAGRHFRDHFHLCRCPPTRGDWRQHTRARQRTARPTTPVRSLAQRAVVRTMSPHDAPKRPSLVMIKSLPHGKWYVVVNCAYCG